MQKSKNFMWSYKNEIPVTALTNNMLEAKTTAIERSLRYMKYKAMKMKIILETLDINLEDITVSKTKNRRPRKDRLSKK